MGAVFASTRFSLVRISIRDLVADGKSLVRNSGVGGGGQNLILIMLIRVVLSRTHTSRDAIFFGRNLPTIARNCHLT